MKLLQLNATANWGSTGKIAEGIGAAAMRRGWQSFVAYGRYMNPSQSGLIKVGNKFDVYAHYARNRFLDGEGLGSKHATEKLIKQIEEIRPDIIQLHNIHDHWLNYPILFDYLATIATPIVWTLHDCWPFTGGCYHFVQNECNSWKSSCESCSYRNCLVDKTKRNFSTKRKLFLSLGKRLTVVSVSQWLDSLAAQSYFSAIDHRYIHNGIDIDTFSPTQTEYVKSLGLDDKTVLLGVSSVWPASKGLTDYIELRKLLPDNFVIVLVGLPKNSIASLPEGVVGIERTNNVKELAALYSRANAVLSLSQAETFGLTLAEGLSCGTPSIAYEATGVKEILSPQTGIGVPLHDISKLHDAVIYMSDHASAFPAAACRERAVRCFNQETQFNKYIDLYEELLR